MTDDERLISEAWPEIGEEVMAYLPRLDAMGYGFYLRAMPVDRQIAFWRTWKGMRSERFPEVEVLARQALERRGASPLVGPQDKATGDR